jgi:hypothetical protein
MKYNSAVLAVVILVSLITVAGHAQDFSADVVYLDPKPSARSTRTGSSSHSPSKLYVSENRVRLETHGFTDTILLVNGEENTAAILFPARKAYQPWAAGSFQYFRVQNAEDACPDWQKATAQKAVCEKVGPEMVDGRPAVKYQDKKGLDPERAAVWIDVALKFVVKWEAAGASAELRNIHEEKQAADLFVVPPDYKIPSPAKANSKGFPHR